MGVVGGCDGFGTGNMNFRLRKRGKVWHYDFCVHNERFRGSTGTEAKELANDYAKKVFADVYMDRNEIARLDVLVGDFIKYHLDNTTNGLALKYVKDKARDLYQFYDFMQGKGAMCLADVDLVRLESYKTELLKMNNPKTVKNKLANVSKLFRHAGNLGYVKSNPCSGLEPIRGILKCRPRFLSGEEIRIVKDAVKNTSLELPIYIGLYTGMRRAEICNLHYEDVDFVKRLIYVRHRDAFVTKSRKERVVPLNAELRKKLGTMEKGRISAVLVNWLSERFNTLMDALGLKDVTIHTLRHTFASHLAMAGVPIFYIAQWLGHSTTHVTELYAHLCPDDPGKKEIDKLGF